MPILPATRIVPPLARFALALAIFLMVPRALAAPGAGWRVGPAPAWVTPVTPPAPGDPDASAGAARSGERCLLLDRQVRAAGGTVESFARLSSEIRNEAGLSSASQVEIGFDPTYQTLTIHSVVVRRDGKVLDRLVPGAIKIVQREHGLEDQVFDGRQSAVLFVEDLRVGDVVDYSYTLRGADPTLGGHFADEIYLGGPAPAARWHTRLVVPASPVPHFAFHGPSPSAEATTVTRGDSVEYEWDLHDTPAYVADEMTPRWASVYPWVEVSDFASWQEVAVWGGHLFETKPVPPASALASWVHAAQAEATSPADFALRALRFVQDQVRYVGIETGMGRRQPTDPATVFARRFGDCKDKTALLVAMLRMAGITAMPSLVSTTQGHVLDDSIPTPEVFDHAIVRVALLGKSLWVDPTLSLQGGDLAHYAYSSYERALTLGPYVRALVALKDAPADQPLRSVHDRYTAPAAGGASDEMRLDSERTYRGVVADAMRAVFRSRTDDEKSKFIVGLYQPDFPTVHESAPLEQSDDRDANVLRVVAHLGIPGFWRTSTDGRLEGSVHARSLEDLLPRPPTTKRSQPLSMPFPFRALQTVTLDLPFDLPFKPEVISKSAPSFAFEFASSYEGRRLTYSFEVATRAPAVSGEDLAPYLEAADDARARLSRSVWRYPPLPDGINWAALVAFIGCVPFLAFGAFRAHGFVPARLRPPWEPALPGGQFERFGGWLVVLGIGVVVNPIRTLMALVTSSKAALSLASWSALTTPQLATYAPGIAVLIVVEALLQAWFVAYGLVVATLYFGKRRSFPFHFTVYASGLAAFTVVDQILAVSFSRSPGASERASASVTGVMQTVVWALLWTAYVRQSRRVAGTFVR